MPQDPNAHMMFLKPSPPAASLIDNCMECGYCEAVCPSRYAWWSGVCGTVGVSENSPGACRVHPSTCPACSCVLLSLLLCLLLCMCVCPNNRDITITPRQRIQTYREITRLRSLQDPTQEQKDRWVWHVGLAGAEGQVRLTGGFCMCRWVLHVWGVSRRQRTCARAASNHAHMSGTPASRGRTPA